MSSTLAPSALGDDGRDSAETIAYQGRGTLEVRVERLERTWGRIHVAIWAVVVAFPANLIFATVLFAMHAVGRF